MLSGVRFTRTHTMTVTEPHTATTKLDVASLLSRRVLGGHSADSQIKLANFARIEFRVNGRITIASR